MDNNIATVSKRTPIPGSKSLAATAKLGPSPQTDKSRVQRPAPAACIARARTAFKNFSLSKFAGKSLPDNYVPAKQEPAAVQKAVMLKHLDKLKSQGPSNRAMTVALPKATIGKLLPSYDPKAGTIQLDEVMKLIKKKIRGTEFHANGNPTLNRLSIQNKVHEIINSIKRGRK